MNLITKAPRGTTDILPGKSEKWQFIEKKIRAVAHSFNFSEIRTPTFEHTELFQRGVGDATDIVQKEMYTFRDKGDRSITLRPEGTAPVVRSVMEHGLYGGALPMKFYYFAPCFRYEKPQAGRLREFRQFGVEMFGPSGPAADIELIMLADAVVRELGLSEIALSINSIGCKKCREDYKKALKAYFESRLDSVCSTCRDRFEKNPMRLLDCKVPECREINRDAPVITDYLCEDCSKNFEAVKNGLAAHKIEFTVDPRIVRGLDYYNGLVFEMSSFSIGSQAQVLGGGRYDLLSEEIGGESLPGLGFGMGLDRILMVMEKQGLLEKVKEKPCIFIANAGEEPLNFAAELAVGLRRNGLAAEYDLMGKGLKSQMKYADKNGFRYTTVIGDDEIKSGVCRVRDMLTGETCEVSCDSLAAHMLKLEGNE